MQIHNLPAQTTAADADVFAIDNGTTTQKITVANLGKKVAEDAKPAFTSNDSATATTWTNVAVLASAETMKSILNKISTMFKNIRYLYSAVTKLNTELNGSSNAVSLMSLGTGLHYVSNPTDAPTSDNIGVAIIKVHPDPQFAATYKSVLWIPITATTGVMYLRTKGGSNDSGWIALPARGEITQIGTEITGINNKLTATRFTASNSDSPFTAAEVIGYHDKAANTVRITFFFRASSAITINTPIATVPEGYRPAINIGGHGIFYAGTAVYPGSCRVASDGNIYQTIGSTITSGYGVIEYALS